MKKVRLRGKTGITITKCVVYGKIDGVGKEVPIYIHQRPHETKFEWGDSFGFKFQILPELIEK